MKSKTILVGLVIGLIIGGGIGYVVSPKTDVTEYENTIASLQKQLDQNQIEITNLENEIDMLTSEVEDYSEHQ